MKKQAKEIKKLDTIRHPLYHCWEIVLQVDELHCLDYVSFTYHPVIRVYATTGNIIYFSPDDQVSYIPRISELLNL